MAGVTGGKGFRKDILAGRRPKGRWWWPGRLFSGRLGMVLLVGFVATGVVAVVIEGPGGYRVRGLDIGVEESAGVNVDAGRPLVAGELGLAARYGRPLYLGDGGLPVVEFGDGAVRELTPVEAEFDSVFLYEDAGYGRVVWGPGPRGWGMWWKDQSETELLRPARVFARLGWRDKQEEELEVAAVVVSYGVALLVYSDMEIWQRGLGEPLVNLMEGLKERHRVLELGHWGAVPGQWVCDERLESDLNQGVTQGCPSSEYRVLLRESWERMGGGGGGASRHRASDGGDGRDGFAGVVR